ncbi:MAG: energy-coupling factor transporter transmembrane component T [Natrialbaceae archaeon]|nr:energy-coupling factor transporter transmembrane component T [Natrialbaceae archaeon]
MITYEPGSTPIHRLDPRSKLAFQIGFGIMALGSVHPIALLVLTTLVFAVLAMANLSLRRAIHAYRVPLWILLLAPAIAAISLGPPWIDINDGRVTALAGYRVFLILLVSGAYIRTTSSRDSRAAIQRTIPGRTGQLLGMGVSIVFRFLPVMFSDLQTIRDAFNARLGENRSMVTRGAHIGARGLERAFERADTLALAMQARCYSWNPTLPALSMGLLDWVVVLISVGFVLTVFV